LSGDLSLPVSLHVGQVSLKDKSDEDEPCPHAALADQAAADEAYAIAMEAQQALAIEEAR